LVVINHLVVDSVSWDIILEDFNSLIEQLKSGKQLSLPLKTDSFKKWVEAHLNDAYQDYLKSKSNFWQSPNNIGNDDYNSNARQYDLRYKRLFYGRNHTDKLRSLLQDNPFININTLFIYAFLKSTSFDSKLKYFLEGHGREENLIDMNFERTIGWFTSLFPVQFSDINGPDDFLNCIDINTHVIKSTAIASTNLWANSDILLENCIIFNYLGNTDFQLENLSKAKYDPGPDRSENLQPCFDGEVNVQLSDNDLIFDFELNEVVFGNGIEDLINKFQNNLSSIVENLIVVLKKNINKNVFEYGNFGLQQTFLESYSNADIQAIYPCSSMQKGLFVYSKINKGNLAYCEKYSTSISGDFEVETLKKAYYRILEKYPQLKSNFVELGNGEIVQLISANRPVGFNFIDISKLDSAQAQNALESFENETDQLEYNLEIDSLFNLTVIRDVNNIHHFVWTQHHIILDGWSNSILLKDFFSIYSSLLNGESRDFSNSNKFLKSYFQWLNNSEDTFQKKFWSNYLSSVELSPIVPKIDIIAEDSSYHRSEYISFLDSVVLDKVREVARKKSLSLNGILHYGWSLLLAKYTNNLSVTFGTVISGRDIPIQGVEEAVGLFINTIPVVVDFNTNKSHLEIIRDIMLHLSNEGGVNHLSFGDIMACSDYGGSLIDHVLVFENFPEFSEDIITCLNKSDRKYSISEKRIRDFNQSNYDFSLAFKFGNSDEISLKFVYNSNKIDASYLTQITKHFSIILHAIVDDFDSDISNVDIIDEPDFADLISLSGGVTCELPSSETVLDYFKQHVNEQPEKVALIADNNTFTYAELDSLSNQFGRYLIDNYNPQIDQLIPVKLDRTERFFIAILAIHKIGAAYVPIEPGYPQSRIDFILSDTKSLFIIDDLEIESFNLQRSLYSKEEIICEGGSERIAYCIYTSGSTGNPKGVLINHKMLLASNIARIHYYDSSNMKIGLLLYSFAFDSSVNLIFKMLVSGGTIVLYKDNEINLDKVISLIKERQVDTITIPPGLHDILLESEVCPSLRNIIVAGEECRPDLVSKHYQRYTDAILYNEYGPTECTVWSTVHRTSFLNYTKVPIGRPIANTFNFILDRWGYLMPIGLKGELCIGGPSVGIGYLNNEQLTQEKFVWSNKLGCRYYKTGDICYWNNDAQLIFNGRRDNQIKIRGFRVELGEIESVVASINGIQNAVAIVKGAAADKQIICFYVGETNQNLVVEEIKRRLPNYMVPSVVIKLDELPLTPHLKIDTKVLLERLDDDTESRDYFEFNSCEKHLADVWSLVLKKDVKKVTFNADFFALGGDSIKAIMLISQLRKFGLEIKISEIMENSIFSEMSKKLKVTTREINQSLVSGEHPLLPMQELFLSNDFIEGVVQDKNYFLLGNLFELNKKVTKEHLDPVFQKLFEHHDSLRARMLFTTKGIKQYFESKIDKLYDIDEFDFSEIEFKSAQKIVSEKIDNLNKNVNLYNGPIAVVAIFSFKDCNLLYFSIHHMFTDLISWRILAADLNQLLDQILKGQKIELPAKTDSAVYWHRQILQSVEQGCFNHSIQHWKNIEQTKSDRLNINSSSEVTLRATDHLNIEFTKEETSLIKSHFERSRHFDIESILFYAIARSFHDFFGLKRIKLNLEGHGRNNIAADFDISRTVGWFTSSYPVLLHFSSENEIDALLNVQHQMESIPDNGISYGWLKLTGEISSTGETSNPFIDFNYHGEYDDNQNESSLLKICNSIDFNDDGENLKRKADFILNAKIQAGNLKINLAYSNQNKFENRKEDFASIYKEKILGLISTIEIEQLDNLISIKQKYPEISFERISNIIKVHGEIEDIFSLTPMQQGLNYLNASGVHDEAYFEQFEYMVNGFVDSGIYERAFNILFEKYDILRAVFDIDQNGKPIQVVKRNISPEFTFSEVNEHEFQREIQSVKQKEIQKGFRLESGPLLRMTLIHNGTNRYFVLWSSHHIILDGWSMAILFESFKEIYHSLLTGNNKELGESPKFGDYARHIIPLCNQEATQFWDNRLEGYENEIHLPGYKLDNSLPYKYSEETIELSSDYSEALQAICNKNKVTLNNLMQVLWALILSKYNHTVDVVFGSIVSGRNVPVNQVENTVGLFINMIPIRITYQKDDTFTTLVRRVQSEYLESLNYHFSHISEIQNRTLLRNSLINHFTVFENYPENDLDQYNNVHAVDENSILVSEQNNYDISLIFEPGHTMKIKVCYNENAFENWSISNLKEHWKSVVRWVIENPKANLERLQISTDFELNHLKGLLKSLNVNYPVNNTILSIFEDVCQKHSGRTALVFEDVEITYEELNLRANKLAKYLQVSYNVKKGDFVTILLPRGEYAIVSIISLIKCGAVYVPIDVNYPQDRIEYIQADCNSSLTIDENVIREFLFNFDSIEPSFSSLQILPDDTLYVIYTSGTTGKPKGSLISHRNVVRLFFNDGTLFDFNENDVWVLFHSYCFDFSVWEMFGALLYGGKLIIPTFETTRDVELFSDLLQNNAVTILNQTPSAFYLLDDFLKEAAYPSVSIRNVIFGGEALNPRRLESWHQVYPETTLINMYGITETTVHVTYKNLSSADLSKGVSNIGTAIPTLVSLILGENGELLPHGSIGEIHVVGHGLSQGYLNQPELTSEKFVHNKHLGLHTYKSGDLGRYLNNFEIEYFGRIDNQVKVRGHRIELSEVENTALENPLVKNAQAIINKSDKSSGEIVLYFVGEATPEELRLFLSERLPDFMVPSYFVNLNVIPLNNNGKVDRSKLPAPVLPLGSTVFKPESEAEVILCSVFEDVLKLSSGTLGADTSFISLGGDSIKSIQVISKLRAKGFKIKVSDIMKMQSIKALAKKLEKHDQPTITQLISGKFGLSPIQHFFFNDVLISGEEDQKHFYNQSYLLDLGEKFTSSFVHECLYDLISHHDSLRIKFERESGNYYARYQSPDTDLFRLHETTIPANLSESEHEDFIIKESENIKIALHLFDGPLLGALIIQSDKTSTILITCHHLLVDLVSWRIIIDDLNTIIKNKLRKAPIVLPEKGSSYFQWVSALEKYAEGQRLQAQIAYWNDVISKTGDRINQQMTEGKSNLSDCASFELTVSETGALLQSLSQLNQLEINSVLLYALSTAAESVLGLKNVRFNMEGHGREEFDNDIHIDRTIGWFTSLFPFNVDVRELASHPVNAVVELNSRLNIIPDKGFGFGLLWHNNYLNSTGFPDYNSIEFNYMGSFNSNSEDNQNSQGIKISPFNHGLECSTDIKSGSIMSVGSMIFDNRFRMKIWFDAKQLPEDIINAFSEQIAVSLRQVVTELLNSSVEVKTANGFNYKNISTNSLHQLEARLGPIEDVLRLTPLQRGIYFHTELDNDPEMYFVQFGFLLKDLENVVLFKEVICEVLSSYDILKVIFTRELDQLPLQMVLKQTQVDIEELDISYFSEAEQKKFLENYFIEQRKIPFNLMSGGLIRIKLIKVGIDNYFLLWNNHHIILDGWSTQILLNDVYRIYSDNLLSSTKSLSNNVDNKNNFRQYVEWLANYNHDTALEFWKNYLNNYEPVLDPFSSDNKYNLRFETKDAELLFDSELTESVYSKAAQLGLTVSTLFQGLWAIIYSKYCISNDVVFGVVTSGRPPSLENIENIVGALINTVPLRIKLNDQESLQDYLRGIEDGYLQVEPHQYVGLSEIQNASGFKSPLISHAIVFENYPVPSEDNLMEPAYKIDPDWNHVFEKNSYNLSLIVLPEKTLRVILKYNTNVISASTIQHIKKSLLNLMHVVVSDSLKKLNEIELLDTDAQLAIVDRCTDATTELYNNSKTLLDQYYEGNLKPSNRAIIFRGKSYTYEWIENESNRFASFLKYFLGIEKGEMVAVQLPRSEYLPVVLLGILKNSCAYVPIALDQPATRTKFMLDDCGSKIVITTEILQIFIQDKIIHPKIEDLPLGNDLIYCLYTSGSTGQPKGCLLQHHSLLNRLKWMQNAYSLSSDDVILQKTPYTFDVSVWELFWWYMYGAQMCLLEQDEEKDPEAIIKAVEDNQVTVIHFVPSMFTVFLDYLESNLESTKRLQSLKQIFTSGEALLGYHLRRWKALLPETKLMNLYGPTEASIDVSYYDCSNWDGFVEEIPIGKPIFNTGLLILGAGNKILPYGSVGEIAISGVGLAKGYLNKPELTSQKFITHPTTSSEKVYLTGDLGRWNAKGELEYLGRLDDQVKIRGNRIELGEITSKVLEFEGVRESVVIAKKIELSSHLELVAYIVGTADLAKLKRYLTDNLPSYMVPSYYVLMESIPLSSSGKVNRKLLPDPENTGLDATEYVVPGTAMEIALAEVWASVLQKNIGKIGLASDFFDLGGDSIKAIQVVSKLRAKGLSLRLADVISKTLLEQQARYIQKAIREISQNTESGEFALGPIQYLFLNNGFMDGKPEHKAHFNQSVIFNLPDWADLNMLAKAWDKLTLHHDALRLRFSNCNGAWIQEYAEPGSHNYNIQTYDLSANDGKNLSETIFQLSESVKKRTHLQKGPLVNIGFFLCKDFNRVLITIHHLAVDVVSWQIIKEDFGNLLLQLKEGKSLELPLKTDSYKNWILAHFSFDYKKVIDKHRIFWEELNLAEAKVLVPKNTPKVPLYEWKDYKRLCWSVSQSQFIEISRKKKSNKPDTVLLYALSKALNKTIGDGVYACYSETHGRIDNDFDLDISRTVGWFTDMYPVLLNADRKNENIDEFLSFHDRVYHHMEMNKSFLWNKHLNSVSDPRPEAIDFVEFNFLGEISNTEKSEVTGIIDSEFNSGAEANQNLTPKARIILVGGFVNGYLQFDISTSESYFSSDTINQLLVNLEGSVAEIINQLVNSEKSLKSGVDFTYNQLAYNEIHAIEQEYGELEDIYGLSPMQKGLFYLGMYNENNQSYCVQFGEKYNGNLNVGFFKEAIFETIANNPSLKAIFRSDIGKDILQIIPKDADVDFEYIDLSNEKQIDHAAYCIRLAAEERSRPFDFSKGKLLRTKLFKWNDFTYYLIWTNHHIILDGWSTSIVLDEIRNRHNQKIANLPYHQESKPLFSEYIKWLNIQKEELSIEFWKNKLKGYNQIAEIKSKESNTSNVAAFYTIDLVFNLSAELSRILEQKAKSMKTTLNVIMQAAYGLILSCYSKKDDVVFGSIVSGRPPQIPDIQKMVGLLFNTIPVRVAFNDKSRLSELLVDIQKHFIESQDYHYLNLADFNNMGLAVRNPIRTLLTFENYPSELANDGYYDVSEEDKFIFEQTNYDLSTIIIPGDALQFIIKYNPIKYNKSQIDEIQSMWELILELIASDEDALIQDFKAKMISLIVEKEKSEIERQKNMNLSKLKKFKK
jgi:amino acid adenylation domain-containing protein/non-ribosomal peptide synthase protein (TIGR01720 family)